MHCQQFVLLHEQCRITDDQPIGAVYLWMSSSIFFTAIFIYYKAVNEVAGGRGFEVLTFQRQMLLAGRDLIAQVNLAH